MSLSVGQTIPEIDVHIKDEDGIDTLNTAAFFADKIVVVFAVPGAFTPTCSAKHLPSYLAHYDALKEAGFDAIVCLSVNDAHVMREWGLHNEVGDKIVMMADSRALFSEALGIAVNMGAVLGTRSTRCAFIADKGTVTHVFMEEVGVYEVSSAEHVLANM